MAFEVGKDVEGLCSSCGDVWHVIVAKVADKITKVQCKQCGKLHRLKPTGDAPDANLNPARRKVDSPRSSSITKSKAPARSGRGRAASAPAGVRIDPDKPLLPYAVSARFAEGDQIKHPKFGDGVVFAVEDNKIKVNFADGAKVLLHGRGA